MRLAFMAMVLLVSAHAAADLVLTTDGKSLDGVARFDADGSLTVTTRTGPVAKVPLDRLLSARFDPLPTAGTTRRTRPADAARAIPRVGVVLTSGAAIAADEILAASATSVRLGRTGQPPLTLPTNTIALIAFDAPTTALPAGDTPGVLLRTGDFVEGELDAYNGKSLTLNSLIFGPRTFTTGLGQPALALRLRAAADPDAARLVRLTDGSTYRSTTLRIQNGRLLFNDPTLGDATAPREDLLEIRPGRDALTPLATLLKTPVTPLPYHTDHSHQPHHRSENGQNSATVPPHRPHTAQSARTANPFLTPIGHLAERDSEAEPEPGTFSASRTN